MPNLARLCAAVALALIADAHAADVTITPAAGSGLVVKDAAGASERMRVQESGAITLPAVPGAATQSTGLCISSAGLLGPCAGGSGGMTYTAGTGLVLTGTAFSVAPTFQLPQGCAANQVAQWSGSAWACATVAGGATLPTGTVDQTLRFNSANMLVANNLLLAYTDGGLVAGGAAGTGTIPMTGAGTRLMWYPAKSALRAGHVGGARWDDANVGDHSAAFGSDAQASGSTSFATGSFTTASGGASTAMGAATTASGGQSVALGDTTTASGTDSTALGFTSTATGDFSTAMGNSTTASGKNSTAMGHAASASGNAAISIGENVTANGDNSVAIGTSASTNGHANSFIWGDGTAGAENDADQQFLVQASGGVKFTSYLEVDGATTVNEEYDYINYGFTGPNDGYCNGCPSHPSVYAPNGYVMAVEFDVLSDARIKDITGRSDSSQDLVRLNAIEITDYHMRDRVRFGDRPEKKVIAQQVEQVFPQLVTKHTDFIPNVYKATQHVEASADGYKLSFGTPHGISANAKRLKLMPENKSGFEQVDIVSIPSDREVIVRASGWTAERVFVFGEEVDDLRTVDYEGLTALNVSATQELSKRLGVQQTQQSQLVAQLDDRAAQIAALQEKLGAQQLQLAAQRTELDAQRDRIAKLQTQGSEIAALRSAVAALQDRQVEPLLTTASTKLGRVEPLATNASVRP